MESSINLLHLFAISSIFFYALAVICAIREIMYSRTSQGSIAWLLSLFFLPMPTVFLYFIFAWKRLDDYIEVRDDISQIETDVLNLHTPYVDGTASSRWPVHTRIASIPFLQHNQCRLLIDGPAMFTSIIEGIRTAEKHILVQFFIIREDSIGLELADVLIERAKAGLHVCLLYDDIGSRALSTQYLSRLEEAGVNVSGFNKRHRLMRILGPMRLNYRNHRKVVVTDSKHCWIGGHNIGEEYLGLSKEFGHWRDTHVKVSGAAALAATLSFSEDWQFATGNTLQLELPASFPKAGGENVMVMPTGPADVQEDCAISFVESISRAKERLWIVSPYFVPGIEVLTALYAAALRGVDVRILLPEKADHWLVWLASYAHADNLASHGIKVYRYLEGFLHEKVILVDSALAGVGTVNFDNRSFNINFEITLWFTGKNMVQQTEKMLLRDFEGARRTDRAELNNRRYAFRVLAQAARLFSPVL
ncbi:putative cardiolipin synthase YwiE [Pseudovibrio axinellae]|uniref:Cardiolipin synthase n=1 Tax=Pseudovibrio axinellae TaxID=989403 RepID=A0A166B0S7_9HYPH|nr:cardiolipin synthase [Pseudovibrio axinellae]KZL21798.1 putative cardiolipin synthase YwiE [Pseudovibrio axinellae]SEQ78952.1 cardiolipin synthase [Pseudovibrio axinellae]